MSFEIDRAAESRITLQEFYLGCAEEALALQSGDGSLPAGHNGPRGEPETPARNTAHWAIVLCDAWLCRGDRRFKDAAERALAYLLSGAVGGREGCFRCMQGERDPGNGLVGQAWVAEALLRVGEALGNGEAVKAAERLFHRHPFNRASAVWTQIAPNGTPDRVDNTWNHQLWFAHIAALLGGRGDQEARSMASEFLKRSLSRLMIYPDGVIWHEQPLLVVGQPRVRRLLKKMRSYRSRGISLREVSVSYHAFCVMGLARLLEALPEAERPWSKRLNRALQTAFSERHLSDSLRAVYGGGRYNPTGFELAHAAALLRPQPREFVASCVNQQVAAVRSDRYRFLLWGSPDPATMAARVCEIGPLAVTLAPDLPITVP